MKLASLDGESQVLLDFEASMMRLPHRTPVEAVAPPSQGLCGVHSHIGTFEQSLSIFPIVGKHGDANAGRARKRVAHRRNGIRQGVEDALRHIAGVLGSGHLGKQDGELVPSEPGNIAFYAQGMRRDDVGRPDLILEHLCHALKEDISDRMTERIVHRLEPIQVEVEQRGLMTIASRAVEDLVHRLCKGTSIPKSSEFVAVRMGSGAIRFFLNPRALLRRGHECTHHRRDDFGRTRFFSEIRDAQIRGRLEGLDVTLSKDQKRGNLRILCRRADSKRLGGGNSAVHDDDTRARSLDRLGEGRPHANAPKPDRAERAFELAHEIVSWAPDQGTYLPSCGGHCFDAHRPAHSLAEHTPWEV
jgi:hypothetical protein